MAKFAIYVAGAVGLFFFLIGCCLLIAEVRRSRKPVQAEILQSAVEQYQGTDGDGVECTFFRSRYEVRYIVDGRLITALVRSPVGTTQVAGVQRKLASNPAGTRRMLYYSPANPEDLSVDPLVRRSGFALIFCSVGLYVVGAATLLWLAARPVEW